MRLIVSLIFTAFIFLTAPSSAFGQVGDVRIHLTDGKIIQVEDAWEDAQGVWYRRAGVTHLMDRTRLKKIERAGSRTLSKDVTVAPVVEADAAMTPLLPNNEHPVWIYLVGGARMQVDEATESADGVWFKRGKLSTFLDRARVERIERGAGIKLTAATPEIIKGSSKGLAFYSTSAESFFMAKFGRRLPVTANGQSGLHTLWGFDHRQSMDVGLHPDSPEGKALIKFLRGAGIPFIAFRSAVPGTATGPHIHIGKPSHRMGAR